MIQGFHRTLDQLVRGFSMIQGFHSTLDQLVEDVLRYKGSKGGGFSMLQGYHSITSS